MTPLPHGGRLAEARRLFPGAPEPWLDLSTGINPHAYPLPALPPACWTRLPEPEDEAALEALAARRYGAASPGMAVAAPGTQALIGLLPLLVPAGGDVAVLGPTYGEHAAAWAAAGHRVRTVERPEALEGAAVAVLCSPNNPDGRVYEPAALLRLADRQAARGGLLVVDEAFADLEDAPGLVPLLPQNHAGAVVLRSFGKAYGLAGLRLGFAVTGGDRAARLRRAMGPWRVSGPALAVGLAALADEAWRREAAASAARDARRLDELLAAAGLGAARGTRLFRLVQSPRATTVHARLGRAGILVRRFPEQPEWLRFGLPARSWERLKEALLF